MLTGRRPSDAATAEKDNGDDEDDDVGLLKSGKTCMTTVMLITKTMRMRRMGIPACLEELITDV